MKKQKRCNKLNNPADISQKKFLTSSKVNCNVSKELNCVKYIKQYIVNIFNNS